MSLPTPTPDRTAVVTGASSGIGRAIACDLARRGYGVTVVARREPELRELASELGVARRRVEVVVADLAQPPERATLLERVEALGLTADILVNNAGLSTLGPVARSDPAAECNMIEVDVAAVADLCSRFLPGMVERRRGAVLNVASMAAFQPLPGQAGYGAAKAFVLSYTRSLAGELRGSGVSVSAVCPGPVDTGFGARAGFAKEDAEAALPSFMWESAETVAQTALDALARGQVVSVPGLPNRVAAMVVQFVPKRLLVPILASRHPGLRD